MPTIAERSRRSKYFVHNKGKEMLINQNKRLTCIKASEEKSYEMRIYDCAREATAVIINSFRELRNVSN